MQRGNQRVPSGVIAVVAGLMLLGALDAVAATPLDRKPGTEPVAEPDAPAASAGGGDGAAPAPSSAAAAKAAPAPDGGVSAEPTAYAVVASKIGSAGASADEPATTEFMAESADSTEAAPTPQPGDPPEPDVSQSAEADEQGADDDSYHLGVGLRAGAYHPSGGSDLGASFALGAELRVGLPILPSAIGQLSVAISAGWLSFKRDVSGADSELGDYDTRYKLTFIPATLEAIYELPPIAGMVIYGGAGLVVYTVRAKSNAFSEKDRRLSITPGMQAFGGVGRKLGPIILAGELRYTNITVNFDTGTTGNGSGLFGQAVVRLFF